MIFFSNIKSIVILVGSLLLTNTLIFAQEEDTTQTIENPLALYSYIDNAQSIASLELWGSYEFRQNVIEARYNYDWDKNISLYYGRSFYRGDWNMRWLQGITFGQGGLGIVTSPLLTYDTQHFYLYNSAQMVMGIYQLPNYLFHWGEAYYKPCEALWLGVADRIYFEKSEKETLFGIQSQIAYQNFVFTLYYWFPLNGSGNQLSVLLGYEGNIKRKKRKH